MLDHFDAHLSELDRQWVFVTHTCDGLEDVRFLADEVKRIASSQEVRITQAGSVIFSQCGPGTAGILYFVK